MKIFTLISIFVIVLVLSYEFANANDITIQQSKNTINKSFPEPLILYEEKSPPPFFIELPNDTTTHHFKNKVYSPIFDKVFLFVEPKITPSAVSFVSLKGFEFTNTVKEIELKNKFMAYGLTEKYAEKTAKKAFKFFTAKTVKRIFVGTGATAFVVVILDFFFPDLPFEKIFIIAGITGLVVLAFFILLQIAGIFK